MVKKPTKMDPKVEPKQDPRPDPPAVQTMALNEAANILVTQIYAQAREMRLRCPEQAIVKVADEILAVVNPLVAELLFISRMAPPGPQPSAPPADA